MAKWKIIVLAGGKGTRMMSSNPKVLQKLCGKEMLNLVLANVSSVIDGEYYVVVPPEYDLIKKAVNQQVKYVTQSEPKGTGHAVEVALEYCDKVENIVVINGDVPLIENSTIDAMVTSHLRSNAALTLLTADLSEPKTLGRVIRDKNGIVKEIVEVADKYDIESTEMTEINSGVYCFNKNVLEVNLGKLRKSESGEMYLTDIIKMLSGQGELIETIRLKNVERVIFGIDTKIDLERGNSVLQNRILDRFMLEGVTIQNRNATYIDYDVKIGEDTIIMPNTHILGNSEIGNNSIIGPNSIIDSSKIGNNCNILSSTIHDSIISNNVIVGPFSNVRINSYLDDNVHLGTSAEVNRSKLGKGTKSSHFSYLGDALVGNNVNIGAGTVTCNYDGSNKNTTIIGDNAFIGSGTLLVAPVKVGRKASTGAGSVVLQDVDEESRVAGVPAKSISKQTEIN